MNTPKVAATTVVGIDVSADELVWASQPPHPELRRTNSTPGGDALLRAVPAGSG